MIKSGVISGALNTYSEQKYDALIRIMKRRQLGIMIKLENITKRNDNEIVCEAYVEDCKTAIPLVFDIEKRKFKDFTFPQGYEYCRQHIAHAKFKLSEMTENNKIEKRATIMWY